MLNAVDYLGPAATGATSPQLFRGDDGRVYVVKLQNNRLGPKALANEFLGGHLGASLGLCFPPNGIIRLEESVLRRSRLGGVTAGRHYASLYFSGTDFLNSRNLAKAANLRELAGVLLFDNIVQNVDRTLNRRNLLLRREGKGYRAYAIDNSHLFRRAQWTEELLSRLAEKTEINRHGVYGSLLKHWLRPADFTPYLERLKTWTDGFLADAVAAIPGEWLPQSGERQAAVHYLKSRRDKVAKVITCLTAFIPAERRTAGSGKES
jgi:hypothetical protein